ncbi:MAG: carboxypeptidase regulatory-like domain-containing protein [Acidobacteria bacterium]|nr:carboxypeptidase regulatory-like domain-containing protein [Acidobacteriota bacterium]
MTIRPRIWLIHCICFLYILFIGGVAPEAARAVDAPVLISEPASTRAIAVSAPTFLREPFTPACTLALCLGQRTRVMLFAMNLTLQTGEDVSVVTAEAEDEAHGVFNLQVEYVGKVPGFDWMSAVVVKLHDDMGDAGDVLVRIAYRGAGSNRVRVGIGHVGGGLADDSGALPTPAPPFVISGLVTEGPSALAGVTLALSGGRSAALTTGLDGKFSFGDLLAGDSYTVTASKPCYSFSPASLSFDKLFSNPFVGFKGEVNKIEGRLQDTGGQAISGATITLAGAQPATTQTGGDGKYSFDCLTPGSYTVTPSHVHYNFNPASQIFVGLAGSRTANFTGTLKTFTIRGHASKSDGTNLAGVTITLGGAQTGSVNSDDNGDYAFAVAARGSYTVSAGKLQFDFTPQTQTFNNLSADQTANFTGALKNYTISGRAATPEGASIRGASVSLGGSQTRATTTDENGDYSFVNVTATGNYTVAVSRIHYSFATAVMVFNNLTSNQTANFTGVAERFNIAGQIVGEGRPLGGLTVGLSGSQTSSTSTDVNGAYQFSVAAEGDYTITPSEKNYYAFAPQGRSFVNVVADQTASFAATRSQIPSPQKVLEFDGSPKTVDYNFYFEPDIDLGHFFWEFWAVPRENASGTYLLSDGYGGAHALLFGFGFLGGSEPGRYQLTGNVWTGSAAITFSSDEGPAVGEWGHYSIGWDGHEIVTYFDGVPVGKTAFAGPRRSGGFINGGGRLLIGGSDHSNLIGRIAQLRGFEGSNPRENTSAAGNDSTHASFAPETVFRLGGNVLSNFFRPIQTVDDLSNGLNGSLHPGRLRGTPSPFGLLTFCEECPRPQYVSDPTAPDFATATDPAQRQFTPPPTPGAALVFDSFSRKNSTYLLEGNGGLGSTEGGSLGAQQWRTSVPSLSRQPFGILNERAVLLANDRALAWVSIESPATNFDILADRHPGRWGGGLDTGLSFRVEDADNYFFAYTGESNQDAGVRALAVGYYKGGRRTDLAAGVLMPRGWTTLQVVTNATGAINVFADGTLVYSTTNTLLASATGAGLYNDRPGLGLSNRWDNFTVY